jgi:predicted site-specific integrase-resolvase
MTTKEAMELIGCKSRKTLYNYREKGLLRSNTTPSGRIYWFDEDVYAIIGKRVNKGKRKVAVYFRVNFRRDKKALADQILRVKTFCQKSGISIDDKYADYGRGTDYSTRGRPELHRLLEDVYKKKISTIIIDHKSRLTSFQWGIMEMFFRYSGVKVITVNQVWDDEQYQKEIKEDLTELLMQIKISSLADLADNTGDYDKGWDDVIDMEDRPLEDDD